MIFLGAKERSDVFNCYKEYDSLVLISHETFGMVYVEAMSQACIPIGVLNDGIDGVVEDYRNGFLVELNNYKQLSNLFDTFNDISKEKIISISKAAYETSLNLTYEVLVQKLIEQFENGCDINDQ